MANYYPQRAPRRQVTAPRHSGRRPAPGSYRSRERRALKPRQPLPRKPAGLPKLPPQAATLRRFLPWLRPAEFIELWQELNSEPQFTTHWPGFSLVAQCGSGGGWDRPWNDTSTPASGLTKGFANNCTISAAYFPGNYPTVGTQSFGLVKSLPIPGQPNRAQAKQVWEAPAPLAVPAIRPGVQRVYEEIAPHPYPIAAQRVQALMPLLVPVTAARPVGEPVPLPLPQRMIKPMRHLGFWVGREVGPVIKSPIKGRLDLPKAQIEVKASGLPAIKPSTHRSARIYPAKERKIRAPRYIAARIIAGFATESYDAISAVHDALPKKFQRSRQWRDKDGKWHARHIRTMLRELYKHWDQIDLKEAVLNLGLNEIEDRIIGSVNRRLNNSSDLTRSIQGAGTNANRAYGSGFMGQDGPSTSDLTGASAFAGLTAATKYVKALLGYS